MKSLFVFLATNVLIIQTSFAVKYESGKFVGKTLKDQKKCSITIDLSQDGDLAKRNRVEYYLSPAYRSTPDVNCPGEHKRYVGFQTSGKEDKELEICVSLTGVFLEYRYVQFSGSLVKQELVCVIEKKI